MKTIVLGDTHGRTIWKQIVKNETFDRLIFIGDYFDSFDISAVEQIHNFKEIIEYKKTSGKEVIMLVGNHDHHYIVGDTGTSGYQIRMAPVISQIVKENIEHLQMAYESDEEDILFSHAGITQTFLDQSGMNFENYTIVEFINELFKFKPQEFVFNGYEAHGDDACQGPIWVRPRSLMKDSKGLFKVQVVGHTAQNCIDIKGKATGGKYYFIDTLGTSKEFLIIENGKFTCKKAIYEPENL